jgi:geranylgeranyl reductase
MRVPEYDVAVVGGGPAGAIAAADLAEAGRSVVLIDRDGRIKPCGGAIPPRLLRDFDVPESLLVARARGARIFSPSARAVDMGIDNGFVGMVDRGPYDEWLRQRAVAAGAVRRTATFERLEPAGDGTTMVHVRPEGASAGTTEALRVRAVVGADGANSGVARQAMPKAGRPPFVFAYHEIVRTPSVTPDGYDPTRCDIHYRGDLSPDFYAWVFPHGDTASIGTGSAHKGFGLRPAVAALREACGLADAETVRREGAPLPLRPMKRWDDGRAVLLAGDAAGVVAPASGEGIYYAMLSGRLAADAIDERLATGDVRALATARRRFMKLHGRVFWILGIMQYFWYASDKRRERFVSLCRDPDIQRLTWQAYLEKELVRSDPMAHVRIMMRDFAHLFGVVSPWEKRA